LKNGFPSERSTKPWNEGGGERSPKGGEVRRTLGRPPISFWLGSGGSGLGGGTGEGRWQGNATGGGGAGEKMPPKNSWAKSGQGDLGGGTWRCRKGGETYRTLEKPPFSFFEQSGRFKNIGLRVIQMEFQKKCTMGHQKWGPANPAN